MYVGFVVLTPGPLGAAPQNDARGRPSLGLGLGFGVWGLGFGVWGLGFRV